MDINDVLTYLPALLIGLGIFYLYLRWKAKENTMNIPIETLGLIVEAGAFIFIIFLVDRYYFTEHNYFTLSIILFIPAWSGYTYWLLKRDDIYMLVSSFQGDTFKDLESLNVKASANTSQRLLVMSREVYETKRHVGDLSYPFWRGSHRIHFADLYDDKAGVFYHHEDARLKNISFIVAKSFWLKIRDDLPQIMRDNIVLTWLSEYQLAHKQNVIKERLKLHLRALSKQHSHEPFKLPDDIDELFDYLKTEKARGLSEAEENIEKGQDSKTEPEVS